MMDRPQPGRCSPPALGSGCHGAERREMEDDLDSAARYLERAEEMRVIAATMADERTRNALLKIAED